MLCFHCKTFLKSDTMGRLTRCLSFICRIGLVNVWKLHISKIYFWISHAAFSAECCRGVSASGTPAIERLNNQFCVSVHRWEVMGISPTMCRGWSDGHSAIYASFDVLGSHYLFYSSHSNIATDKDVSSRAGTTSSDKHDKYDDWLHPTEWNPLAVPWGYQAVCNGSWLGVP